MRTYINFIIAASMLTATLSCTDVRMDSLEERTESAAAPFFFTSHHVALGTDTRTGLGMDGTSVFWKNGDMADVVIWSTDSGRPCDDLVVVEMTCSIEDDISGEAVFKGMFPLSRLIGYHYRVMDSGGNFLDIDEDFSEDAMVVYPSTVDYSLSGTDRIYIYDLPSVQKPTEGSFQDDVALISASFSKTEMIGEHSGSKWTSAPARPDITLHNACGLIRISLPEFPGRDIVSVRISSAGGQDPLTGQPGNLTADDDGRLIPDGTWTLASGHVELHDGGNAIDRGIYYAVVWPGVHEGLTLMVTDVDGMAWIETIEHPYEIKHSEILRVNIDSESHEVAEFRKIGSVTGVTLDHDSVTINGYGQTCTLTPSLVVHGDAPAENPGITWTSSDTGVAVVDNGVVTSVSQGSATVKVMTDDGGYSASCVVTVERPAPVVGNYIYDDGSWGESSEGAVARVFWVGDPTANDRELLADHPHCTHGLAATLSEVGKTNSEDSVLGEKWMQNQSTMMGYSFTQWIYDNNKDSVNGPFKNLASYTPSAPSVTSGWYLPSFAEARILVELGYYDYYSRYWVATTNEAKWKMGYMYLNQWKEWEDNSNIKYFYVLAF